MSAGDDAARKAAAIFSSGKGKIVSKFECPFDLETVFTLQYNTEGLKGVLGWIIEHLGQLKGELGELDTKVMSKLMQVDKQVPTIT